MHPQTTESPASAAGTKAPRPTRYHLLSDKDRARFWSRVDTSGGEDACWPFVGALGEDGYGLFAIWDGRKQHTLKSHRTAWTLTHGPLPSDTNAGQNGTAVRQSCDNRRCCNPRHLKLGMQRYNLTGLAEARRAGRINRGFLSAEQEATIRALMGRPECPPLRDLASLCGVSPKVVARAIRRLRKMGAASGAASPVVSPCS